MTKPNCESKGPVALRFWPDLLPAAVAVLVVDLLLLFSMMHRAPEALNSDSLRNDALGYYRLGSNLWTHRVFSRSVAPPLIPDMVRTPVYPLVVGLLTAGGTSLLPLFAFQIALDVAACLVATSLAGLVGGRRASHWTGLLFAANLSGRLQSSEVMTETLFVFLVLSALYVVCRVILDPLSTRPLRQLALGATLLSLTTLVRPPGLYIPVIMIPLIWLQRQRIVGGVAAAREVLVFGFIAFLLPGFWIARNQRVFNYPKLTSIGANAVVYCVGAGAYSVHHGVDQTAGREMVTREYQIPTFSHVQNLSTPATVKEDQERLRAVQFAVISRFPAATVKSLGIGLAKGLFGHNGGELAEKIGTEWNPPGFGNAIRDGLKSVRRCIADNGLFLTSAVVAMTLYNLLMVCGGVASLFSPSTWRSCASWMIAGVCGYLLVMILAHGLSAQARSRAPMTPVLCVLVGITIASLRSRQGPGSVSAGLSNSATQ